MSPPLLGGPAQNSVDPLRVPVRLLSPLVAELEASYGRTIPADSAALQLLVGYIGVLEGGIDVLMLVHAVLLGGRSVVDASRGLPRAKASYWRTAFRLVLNEIAALLGLATDEPRRPPVPERYALQDAVMVATVRKSAG